MKLTRWTVALYMALVFACGGVVGAFAHRLYTVSGVSANVSQRNPEEFRKRYMADMKSRLQLSDEQADKLGAILIPRYQSNPPATQASYVDVLAAADSANDSLMLPAGESE